MAKGISVQQHLAASGVTDATLIGVVDGIADATKIIEAKIRSAGLNGIYGAAGAENVQGEQQQKLDVFANDTMRECLRKAGAAALVSEEDEAAVELGSGAEGWVAVFDPLDGSSNIDVNVNVGTIFGVYARGQGRVEDAALRRGAEQVAAGYVVYGPATMLVLTTGRGVHGYTLDQAAGEFLLSAERMEMPEQGGYYSVNEANAAEWPEAYQTYVEKLRTGGLGRAYSSRYIGSLVADFHRTLLKGGVFLYPPTKKQPKGKLRLLYEANPLAMLAEQSGGMATNGVGRILEVLPEALHERTSFCVGSQVEMRALVESVRA